jgi:hypothetical protein
MADAQNVLEVFVPIVTKAIIQFVLGAGFLNLATDLSDDMKEEKRNLEKNCSDTDKNRRNDQSGFKPARAAAQSIAGP